MEGALPWVPTGRRHCLPDVLFQGAVGGQELGLTGSARGGRGGAEQRPLERSRARAGSRAPVSFHGCWGAARPALLLGLPRCWHHPAPPLPWL